jgi:hypothetical protein
MDKAAEANPVTQEGTAPAVADEVPPNLSTGSAPGDESLLAGSCQDAAPEGAVPAVGHALAAGISPGASEPPIASVPPIVEEPDPAADAEPGADIDMPAPRNGADTPAPRPAHKYRARLGQRSLEQPAERRRRKSISSAAATHGTLDAELAVFVQPGGWGIRTALVLRRAAEMPEDISIRLARETYDLGAVGPDFYEPLPLADALDALADGIATESGTSRGVARWVRGGRSLHIFTARTGIAGFVSSARAVMGQENLLLCTTELAEACLAACAAAGSPPPAEVSGPGIPQGWQCFRGIIPTRSTVPSLEGIFLALVPHPQATVELGGGIPLGNSAWLIGYPPTIQIAGATPAAGEVTIDGNSAASSGGQGWTAPGWDLPGSHAIAYAGISRSYELLQAPDAWEPWQAHAANGIVLCGAMATGRRGHPAVASSRRNVWLVGGAPGDIEQTRSQDGHPISVAAPGFMPVWEIELHPGRRSRNAVRLIGLPSPLATANPAKGLEAIHLWCHVLRTAGPEPSSLQNQPNAVRELWAEYRNAARTRRRRRG